MFYVITAAGEQDLKQEKQVSVAKISWFSDKQKSVVWRSRFP